MTKTPLNTKSLARIAAIQVLYQFNNDNSNENLDSVLLKIIEFYKSPTIHNDLDIDKDIKIRPSHIHLKSLVKSTHENLDKIDIIIEQHLTKEWKINNLPKLLLAILRVSISEIKYFPNIPVKVSINEYTDIANDLLNQNDIGFVNSVLDKFGKVAR